MYIGLIVFYFTVSALRDAKVICMVFLIQIQVFSEKAYLYMYIS